MMGSIRFLKPFDDVWVTESLSPSTFVRLFSPVLVDSAETIFTAKNNVVIKGTQGSGKSMLMALLGSDIRVAYRDLGLEYPLPPSHQNFLFGYVNLTREQSASIAMRAEEYPVELREKTVASMFADYLNCLMCANLIGSLRTLCNNSNGLIQTYDLIPRLILNSEHETDLVTLLLSRSSWRGFVESGDNLERVSNRLTERIRRYRSYLNYNETELPLELQRDRSVIGEPAEDLAECLRLAKVVSDDCLVIVGIDQLEQLYELGEAKVYGHVFRQVVNQALAKRDSRVVYRVGTRHYSWEEELRIWGGAGSIEEFRDYVRVDIEELLLRKEHTTQWVFRRLATDVARRRLLNAKLEVGENFELKDIFGKSKTPRERAAKYLKDVPISFPNNLQLSTAWRDKFGELWLKGDQLSVWLGFAWLQQRAQVRSKAATNDQISAQWPTGLGKWWVKERNEAALMQIAGSRQAAIEWSGDDHIVGLCGGNILAFITLCRSIWAIWQRKYTNDFELKDLPDFSDFDQSSGVMDASHIWYSLLVNSRDGHKRSILVSAIGKTCRQQMLDDLPLSNPGHTGISLLESDTASNVKLPVVAVLKVCRGHGDIVELPHTSKMREQSARKKYYLHPLLCPKFRIPAIRTKEPRYLTLTDLQNLFQNGRTATTESLDSDQGVLF